MLAKVRGAGVVLVLLRREVAWCYVVIAVVAPSYVASIRASRAQFDDFIFSSHLGFHQLLSTCA